MDRMNSIIEGIADHVLAGAGKAPHVVLGPVVWEPNEAGRRWYFTVAGSGSDGGFRIDRIAAETQALAEDMRSALRVALIQRRPIVTHDTNDELQMARLCVAIWPCQKTAKIAAGIEAERQASA